MMPGPPFARDFVAGGDVDDVDRQIGKLRGKGRGKVVAARLDQDQVEIRKKAVHIGDCRASVCTASPSARFSPTRPDRRSRAAT